MPRVPTYDDSQVRTQPLPSARLSYTPSNPGRAIGAGLQNLGADVQNVALAEAQKQSEIAVLEADRKLSAWVIDRMHNPETGALNRKGKDAFGLPDEVLPAYDKTVEDIEKDLANDAQRTAFRKLSSGRRLEVDRTINRHVSNELRDFENAELEAYIKTAHNAALANPDEAGNEIERQRLAITAYANRNGMGAEWLKLKLGSSISSTHLNIIEGMLAKGQDQRALDYYKKNEPQLLAEDRTRAEKALDVGTLRGASQREADRITREYTDPSAMIAAVEQIKDPKLRDATEERVQRKIRFLAEVNKQAIDKIFADAWTVVERTGSTDDISPADWGALPPNQRKALETYARQRASGQDIVNDDRKWLEFLSLPDRKLAEMSEADLLAGYMRHFDKPHRERAMTRWADARGAAFGSSSTAKVNHARTLTFDDIVNTALAKSGIGLELGYSKSDLKKLSDEKQKIIADFVDAADSAVKRFEMTQLGGKRPANTEEMRKVIDELLLQKVFVKGRLWGGEEKPVLLLTESERKRAQWPGVPEKKEDRVPGQIYNTPKGPLRWDGKVWHEF